MRCRSTNGKAMRQRLSAVFFAALVCGSCSIDFFPTRVDRANRAVVSFLINYTRAQSSIFGLTGRYEHQLAPAGESSQWLTLAPDYAGVTAHHYTCRFDVHETKFGVTCTPEPSSGLRISFYVDESRAIRLSAKDLAGPSSPRLRLDPEEERDLYGDSRSPR